MVAEIQANSHLKRTLLALALLVLCFAQPTYGQRSSRKAKSETIGDLLRNIDKKDAKIRTKKTKTSLPPARQKFSVQRNLHAVKPPRPRYYMNKEEDELSKLEKSIDASINEAYKLSQQYRKSPSRGEIWLRLGELYVEKARIVEMRLQKEYDKKLDLYNEKKLRVRPRLNLSPSRIYYRKANRLYEWFVRDFKKHPKMDQALFFLGYNYFELGQEDKGSKYYRQLSKKFPKSPFVTESNFALGEFYFERERWKVAYRYYFRVLKNKRSHLRTYAMYKAGWCLFKVGRAAKARKYLEQTIFIGKRDKSANKVQVISEAMKDLVLFFGESGKAENARSYFFHIAGSKKGIDLLEKLAYFYADKGLRSEARLLFKQLIDMKPTSPKAFDYQYQIVSTYGNAGDSKVFRLELFHWIQEYGPESRWAKVNSHNQELITEAMNLRETTLRNHVLQQHQTAQNNRKLDSQKRAEQGYRLFLRSFPNSESSYEMRFFYGELLYDMKAYDRAAENYLVVINKKKDSPLYKKALLNAILALEHGLPTENEMQERTRGSGLKPIPFTSRMALFEKLGKAFIEKYPREDGIDKIKFRLGRLHYGYNHFPQALNYFNSVIKDHPRSQYVSYSANLILDIYNLQGDYVGLEKASRELLTVPVIASSKLAGEIKDIAQKSSFKRAESLQKQGKFGAAAEQYAQFSKRYGQSSLAVPALFNAGANFQKVGKVGLAVQMFENVAKVKNKKFDQLSKQSIDALANINQKIGDFEKAAEYSEEYAKRYPQDSNSTSYLFNAAVLRESLGQNQKSIQNYKKYEKVNKGRDSFLATFAIAEIYRGEKKYGAAIAYYDKYIKSRHSDPEMKIKAHYQIAKLYDKQGKQKAADQWYEKTINVQNEMAKQKAGVGARYAAEAKFDLAFKMYEELVRIRLPNNPQALKNTIDKKLEIVGQLGRKLSEVITYDDGYFVVASQTTIGMANDHMVEAILAAPAPASLKGEALEEYKKGVETTIVQPLRKTAAESFRGAIQRARDFGTYDEWVMKAIQLLQKYDKQFLPDFGERASRVELVDWMGL